MPSGGPICADLPAMRQKVPNDEARSARQFLFIAFGVFVE